MLALVAGQGLAAELDRTPVEATTVDGQKVRLFPNGRWEFADAAKAAQAQKIAAEYPETRTRPVEAQGGAVWRRAYDHARRQGLQSRFAEPQAALISAAIGRWRPIRG
jgi:hypothetical protein